MSRTCIPPRPAAVLRVAVMAACLALAGAGCGGGSGGHGSSGHTLTTRTGPSAAPPNGVASKSAGQIVAAATRAVQRVSAVHVSGAVVENGIPVSLDLRLVRGQGGQGEMAENGLSFRLISLDHVLYILGSRAFWTHFGGATAAQLFQGKWLKTPDSGQFATLGDLASIPSLFGQLLRAHGKLAKAGRATVNGQPAVAVRDTTVYVAATGPPYPLAIVKRGMNGGHVSFTDFDQTVRLRAPVDTISLPSAG